MIIFFIFEALLLCETYSDLMFFSSFSNRNLEDRPPEMTMERAVNLLSQDSEETLVSAATYIQNQCLKSDDAKKMVCLRFFKLTWSYCVHHLVGDSQHVADSGRFGNT